MPKLVVDARTVRPGMTGVGRWAMELTRATARLAAKRGDWSVAALTLAHAHGPGAAPSTAFRETPSPRKGFALFHPSAAKPSLHRRVNRREEDELDRIERVWSEADHLLRVPVNHDYQTHPQADLWFHGGGLGRLLSDLKADVFFSPTFLAPLRAPCPTIATLLDFIAWRYPQTYPPGFRHFVRVSTRLAVARASALVALSESVQRDARSILHVSRRKIRVIYPGVAREFRPMPEGELVAVRAAHDLPPPPYFIWIGSIERRKDLPTLLRAFEALAENPKRPVEQQSGESSENQNFDPSGSPAPVSLLIVGRKAPGGDDAVARLQRSPARAAIRWRSDLPQGVLAAALAGASALVFTSRYEGFGLPVAEALACGTPVIAARASSIPEVAGDAALFFNPGDAEALRRAMQHVLHSPAQAADRARQGLARAEAFQWDRAAALLLDLADKVHARSAE